MNQPTRSDFQDKLLEALKNTEFVLPPGKFLDQVEDETDEELKSDHYSPKQLAEMITVKRVGSLVPITGFNRLKFFLQYIQNNYKEFKSGSEGMSDYIKKYHIDPYYRSLIKKYGYIETEGLRAALTYKWAGKPINDEDVYEMILEVRSSKKTSLKCSPSQQMFITKSAKKGMTDDEFRKEAKSHFNTNLIDRAVKKFQRHRKELYENDVADVEISKGYIPSRSAILQDAFDPKVMAHQHLVINFMLYHKFGCREIASVLGKKYSQVFQQLYYLKTKGLDNEKAYLRHLSENNGLLNTLFKDETAPAKEEPKEKPKQLDLTPTTDESYNGSISNVLGDEILYSNQTFPTIEEKVAVVQENNKKNRREISQNVSKKGLEQVKELINKNNYKIQKLQKEIKKAKKKINKLRDEQLTLLQLL